MQQESSKIRALRMSTLKWMTDVDFSVEESRIGNDHLISKYDSHKYPN